MRKIAAGSQKSCLVLRMREAYHVFMDIYLDDKISLMLTRATATNRSIMLVPTDVCQPAAPDIRYAKLLRFGIPELMSYLQIPKRNPLGIVVPDPQNRVRAIGIHSTVDRMTRLGAPFLLLCDAGDSHATALVPKDSRVYVQHPARIVLGMARRLRRLELAKKLTRQQALLMMVKLCLELCGTYAHDPFDPNNASVVFNIEQRLTCDELKGFLKGEGNEQGLSLARDAVKLAYDLSGSPQESFMGPALFFSSRLGGLGLCDFVANKELDLTPKERASIEWRTITPDFQLVGYNAVVEYLGEIHKEGDNPRIDHRRSLDYQTLGKREFAFWYEDVNTQKAFMESAARLKSAIEQFDGPAVRKRFKRLASNPAFQKRQRTLFSVFRPWLRCYSIKDV